MEHVAVKTRDWIDAEAFRLLACARSTADIIDALRAGARPTIGCDGFCFVLRDGALCHYAAEDAMGPLWEGQRFPMEACVSGWAMRTGEFVVIPDIFQDDRVPHALYSQTFVRSMAMAPAGEPADAALGAYWSEAGRPSSRAMAVLQDLAGATGEALTRIRALAA